MANKRKDERRKQIIKLREKGLTIYEISQKVGIQTGLVSYYLKNE